MNIDSPVSPAEPLVHYRKHVSDNCLITAYSDFAEMFEFKSLAQIIERGRRS